VMGVSLGVGVPGEGTVSGSKLSNPFNYDSGLLYLDGTNDRVGVGTTNPTTKLDVNGNSRIGGAVSRSNSGLTVGFTNNTTFAANTDADDSRRMLSIINESTTTNAMSVLGFRVNPEGNTANAMLDLKFVNTGATNTSALHYSFNHGGTFADRFSILSNGSVGIGIANPNEILCVSKNSPDPYNTVLTHLKLINSAGNEGAGNRIQFATGAATAWIQSLVSGPNSSSGSDLVFGTPSTGTVGTERLRITSSGNVGIGTANPGAKLSVGSGSLVDGNVPVQISTPSANGIAYYGANNNGSYGALFGYDRGAYSGGVVRVVGATDTIDFVVNNTTKAATILPSGNFGIGTENPVAKLEVQSSAAPKIISNYNNSKHIGMSVGGSGGGFTLSDGHFLTINHQPYADRGTDANLTERVRITSSGNVQLPGRTFVRNGSNTVIAASGSYLECIGFKDSNASAFDMFDIVGIQGQTTVSLEIRHGHEGGGMHGSWLRWVGALNAYTDITVNYNVANNYGGGLGFTITRPQHDIIRVTWNGANGFPSSFSLACRIWLGRNPNVTTLTNLGMNGFSSSINYS